MTLNPQRPRIAPSGPFETGALPNVSAADNASQLIVSGGVWQTVVPTGFHATVYVDPTFGGTQLGTEQNPFTTCAAAFASMLALGLTKGIIFLAPGTTLVENVVFPTSGVSWEITTTMWGVVATSTTIQGTVDLSFSSATPAAFMTSTLSNLVVTGLISGTTTGSAGAVAQDIILNRVRNNGGMTITTAAANSVVVFLNGLGTPDANFSTSGRSSLPISVPGALLASNWRFLAAATLATATTSFGTETRFTNCVIDTASVNVGAGSTGPLGFLGCTFSAALTITSAVAQTVNWDGQSMASVLGVGLTYAGAGTVTTKTLNAQRSVTQLIANNVAATNVTAKALPGLYEVVATLDLVAAGTAGTAVLNVIYTDLTGTLQTKAVTLGLLITAAVGTEASGSLLFRHNGATAIQFSVIGVVTPGALSINMAVAVMRRD